jgi:copper homeostasis protein
MDFRLEICADGVKSAIEAQNAGASRIELCGNLAEGGITPGYGTVMSARSQLDINLHVLIRPRAGDFLYSDVEMNIMRRDIEICRKCGADGIVIGLLRPDGSIDLDRTSELAGLARPMSVTFHRAFDLCSDPLQGLEDVIRSGADRLLTSGQRKSALAGAELLSTLVKQAGERIIIMPGGGINEENIGIIAKETGAREFHLSARKTIASKMIFRREGDRKQWAVYPTPVSLK